MCGIIGMIGYTKENNWKRTYRLMKTMLVKSERRGEDATGFVALTDPYDARTKPQRLISDKAPLKASQFVEENSAWKRLRHQRCRFILGHVRAATHGSPKRNENNHPHHSLGYWLVHNGVVNNHREIADRYILHLRTECDSEVLLKLVQAMKHPVLGMVACLEERPGAIAVYDSHRGVIYLGRDESRPLWLMRMKRERRWFFASTSEILIESLKTAWGDEALGDIEMLFPLPAMTVITLTGSAALLPSLSTLSDS